MKFQPAPIKTILIMLVLILALAGCLGLAEDITPPPAADTPPPTQAPEREDPTPVPEADQDQSDPQDPGEKGLVRVIVEDLSGENLLEGELVVRLDGFEGFEPVYQDLQTAPESGLVEFKAADLQPGRVFFASVSYGGAVYRSEIIEITSEDQNLDLVVQIYDTTVDPSNLVIDRVHVVVDFPTPDLVQVVEIYILSNLGQKTVVAGGEGAPAVVFPLPEGASDIRFENGALGGRYLETETGFGDTVSIPPGRSVYQVLVSYTLPYRLNRLKFSQEVAYPVSGGVVMVPADLVRVAGKDLEDQGQSGTPGGTYQIYSLPASPAGSSLEFRISGRLDGGDLIPDYLQDQPLVLAAVIVGLGLILAGGILFLITRWSRPAADQPADLGDRDEILDSILALEDLYQSGEVAEAAYQKKRDQLKEQLRELEKDRGEDQ